MGYRPLYVMANGVVGGRVKHSAPYFRTKKLAIVGASGTERIAPFMDPSWTVATHTCARKSCLREPDWYFDLHRPECFKNQNKKWNPAYYTWLQNLQTPIFMQQAYESIPMSVAYPLDRILAEFRPYFANHAAFMIALAMTEGVETIGVFGCEYQHGSEYAVQRGSLEYWLGRAEQAGIKLVLPNITNDKLQALLNYPRTLYGYGSHDAEGKLTGDYKRVEPATLTVQTTDGPIKRALTLIDMDSAEGRPPLAKPPEGVEINWAKSGHTIHS